MNITSLPRNWQNNCQANTQIWAKNAAATNNLTPAQSFMGGSTKVGILNRVRTFFRGFGANLSDKAFANEHFVGKSTEEFLSHITGSGKSYITNGNKISVLGSDGVVETHAFHDNGIINVLTNYHYEGKHYGETWYKTANGNVARSFLNGLY